MRNKDGLSDADFKEAIGLARTMIRRRGVNAFYVDCESFAKRRALTLRQLECLRADFRTPDKQYSGPKLSIKYFKSRRPITLPTVNF